MHPAGSHRRPEARASASRFRSRPLSATMPGPAKIRFDTRRMRLIFARMHMTFNRRRSFRTSLPAGCRAADRRLRLFMSTSHGQPPVVFVCSGSSAPPSIIQSRPLESAMAFADYPVQSLMYITNGPNSSSPRARLVADGPQRQAIPGLRARLGSELPRPLQPGHGRRR